MTQPRVGKDCKVSLGANSVLGMGMWRMPGIVTEQFDSSEFGDNWKKFEFGMKDGGTITFNGLYDPDDDDGQNTLMLAQLNNTDITNLRLYINNTSYFEPCQTTGYFNPSNTSGQQTKLSNVNVTSYEVSASKNGLMEVSFECKVSGVMVLV